MVNLPSEKVPAPPSPNCIFEKVLRTLLFIKLSTSCCLSSTVLPCSIIIGLILFLIKVKAAKSPAGPAPTTTLFLHKFKLSCDIFLRLLKSLGLFSLAILGYLFSFFTSISTE